MAGKSTGERIPGRKYRQVVEAAAVGDPINRIARNLKFLGRLCVPLSNVNQEILQNANKSCANRIEDTIDEANLSQANFVYGTATDKIGQLSGDPALIIRHEHQHLHARAHKFVAITRDKFDEILASLPDDPDDHVSQSSLSTPIDLSLLPDEQEQNTAQEAQSNATAAVPAQEHELAQDSSGMHPHSQPESSKKAAEPSELD